jgi:hypothetical protein
MYGLQKRPSLVNSAIMSLDRPLAPHDMADSAVAPGQRDDDADLKRLLHSIVHDFKGDTSAYFESLKRKLSSQADDDLESRIARRFAKSL